MVDTHEKMENVQRTEQKKATEVFSVSYTEMDEDPFSSSAVSLLKCTFMLYNKVSNKAALIYVRGNSIDHPRSGRNTPESISEHPPTPERSPVTPEPLDMAEPTPTRFKQSRQFSFISSPFFSQQ